MYKKILTSTFIVATAILSMAWFTPATAQQDVSGQGLEITPPIINVEADPGDTKVIEIGVRNITDIDVETRGEVNDFTAKDESGDPEILLGEGESSPFPLADYIAEVPDLEIAPTEQEVARVTISVPEDASPGAHMGVVRFSAVPAEGDGDGSQVSLSAGIGTLVFLHVSGDAEYDLDIEELSVSQNGEVRDWFERGPLTIITRLKNEGNVFLQPSGELRLTNAFGREVGVTRVDAQDAESEEGNGGSQLEFNSNERYVLPSSIRRFEEEIDKDFWFGRYTLTADLAYGPDDTALTSSIDFWVIPYKLLAIVAVLLLVIAVFSRKTLRTYKKHVIRNYQQQNGNKNPSTHDTGQSSQS